MPEQPLPADQPPGDAKFQSQRDALLTAFRQKGINLEVEYDEHGAPLSMHQEGHLLVRRDDFVSHARRVVPNMREVSREIQTQETDLIRVAVDAPGRRVPARDLKAMRDDINRSAGRRSASLNTIISIAPVGQCPAAEPVPVPADAPPNPGVNPDTTAGTGVKVLVIDTGLVPDYEDHPWLASPEVGGRRRNPSEPGSGGTDFPRFPLDPKGPVVIGQSRVVVEPGEPNVIKEYAGHGTFIAGVVRCVAPATNVFVSNAMQDAGGILDDNLHDHLRNVLNTLGWPDIISLSAGACTADNRLPAGLEDFVRELGDHPETVLIAACGNHGNRHPFWPAALAGPFPEPVPGVVSVGALRRDGKGLACFSNFGPWVSVYAPGERLVNAFVSKPTTYRYRDPNADHCRYHPFPPLYEGCTCVAPQNPFSAEFHGMAEWSGTSFSTPIVAGMIADRMSKTGLGSREAAAAVLADANHLECVGLTLLPPEWTSTEVDHISGLLR